MQLTVMDHPVEIKVEIIDCRRWILVRIPEDQRVPLHKQPKEAWNTHLKKRTDTDGLLSRLLKSYKG
jgi:hypothetical protein